MNSKLSIAIALSIFGSQVTASESHQREATLSEFQEVDGLHVLTSELNLDVPLYARFVLVTAKEGKTNETILADLDFPATYFKFLNVTDAREAIDRTKPNGSIRRYIRLTTWVGKKREHVQGRIFNFLELDVGSQSSGNTCYLETNAKVNVDEDIVVWNDIKENTSDRNIKASQKLVLRLYPKKP